jgi:mono/diheme cytochrome c family protein
MKLQAWLAIAVILLPSKALADDIAQGRLLAQQRCAPCHAIAPHQRDEVADSPAFEVIARKYGFDEATIAAAVLAPHPRMNWTFTPRQAKEIAAYINSLPR